MLLSRMLLSCCLETLTRTVDTVQYCLLLLSVDSFFKPRSSTSKCQDLILTELQCNLSHFPYPLFLFSRIQEVSLLNSKIEFPDINTNINQLWFSYACENTEWFIFLGKQFVNLNISTYGLVSSWLLELQQPKL